MVTEDDIIIALSNSGETEEILKLIPLLKKIGTKIIAVCGNPKSALAKHSDCFLDVGVEQKKGLLGVIPSASTTAMLAMGDTLALVLVEERKFRIEDFAFYHPGGTIGRKLLLKVEDIMRKGASHAIVDEDKTIKEVLLVVTKARAGSATVVNKKGRLAGIFTDGDLRRKIETDPKLLIRKVKRVMTKKPVLLKKDDLAVEALKTLQKKKDRRGPCSR